MERLSESRSSSVRKYKHIVIPKFGGPENLLLAEDELLEPQANEVHVKVLDTWYIKYSFE